MPEVQIYIPWIKDRMVYGHEDIKGVLHLSHGNMLCDSGLYEFENPIEALRFAAESGMEVVWE